MAKKQTTLDLYKRINKSEEQTQSWSQGSSPCCWIVGFSNSGYGWEKAPRALRGTAVLKCSTAMPCPAPFPRDECTGEALFPPPAAPEIRHCHLPFSGCNRKPASTAGAEPAALLGFPERRQSCPRGTRRVLVGARTACRLFLVQSVCVQASWAPTAQGWAPSTDPAVTTAWSQDKSQTQARLSYVCMFIISKYSIYIRYSNNFENFIQKQVSTKLNQHSVYRTCTHMDWKNQHSLR